ncbi:hypothetical protein LQZ19_04975 [Treponema primitia]|uniref:DUF5724 domain-containing protein n=1 Tax=Treponema primitia TaxID=88058 RepID=UPI0039806B04
MLEKRSLPILDDLDTAEKLIAHLVRENVRAYNARAVDGAFFRCLSQRELEDGVYTGKVGFGGRMNEGQADEEEAVRNALQCFEDGIFRIVLNDTELEGKTVCVLREGESSIADIYQRLFRSAFAAVHGEAVAETAGKAAGRLNLYVYSSSMYRRSFHTKDPYPYFERFAEILKTLFFSWGKFDFLTDLGACRNDNRAIQCDNSSSGDDNEDGKLSILVYGDFLALRIDEGDAARELQKALSLVITCVMGEKHQKLAGLSFLCSTENPWFQYRIASTLLNETGLDVLALVLVNYPLKFGWSWPRSRKDIFQNCTQNYFLADKKDRDSQFEKILVAAGYDCDSEKTSRLMDCIASTDSNNRAIFVRCFLEKPETRRERDFLFAALNDKSMSVRTQALETILTIKPPPDEAVELLSLMPATTDTEAVLVKALRTEEAKYSAANGFGLYDPDYAPQFPPLQSDGVHTLKSIFDFSAEMMETLIGSLCQTIREHQDYTYRVHSWDDSVTMAMLGTLEWPQPRQEVYNDDTLSHFEQFVLHDVWQEWLKKNALSYNEVFLFSFLLKVEGYHKKYEPDYLPWARTLTEILFNSAGINRLIKYYQQQEYGKLAIHIIDMLKTEYPEEERFAVPRGILLDLFTMVGEDDWKNPVPPLCGSSGTAVENGRPP